MIPVHDYEAAPSRACRAFGSIPAHSVKDAKGSEATDASGRLQRPGEAAAEITERTWSKCLALAQDLARPRVEACAISHSIPTPPLTEGLEIAQRRARRFVKDHYEMKGTNALGVEGVGDR
jgi:hypothetical protein